WWRHTIALAGRRLKGRRDGVVKTEPTRRGLVVLASRRRLRPAVDLRLIVRPPVANISGATCERNGRYATISSGRLRRRGRRRAGDSGPAPAHPVSDGRDRGHRLR